jgi:hypothetical protein
MKSRQLSTIMLTTSTWMPAIAISTIQGDSAASRSTSHLAPIDTAFVLSVHRKTVKVSSKRSGVPILKRAIFAIRGKRKAVRLIIAQAMNAAIAMMIEIAVEAERETEMTGTENGTKTRGIEIETATLASESKHKSLQIESLFCKLFCSL